MKQRQFFRAPPSRLGAKSPFKAAQNGIAAETRISYRSRYAPVRIMIRQKEEEEKTVDQVLFFVPAAAAKCRVVPSPVKARVGVN